MKQMTVPKDSAVDQLALLFGIEPEYVDNWGRIQRLTHDAKKKVLKAMDVVLSTDRDATNIIEEHVRLENRRLTEPTIVADIRALPKRLSIRVRGNTQNPSPDGLTVALTVEAEQGAIENFTFAGDDMTFLGSVRQGKGFSHRWSLPFPCLTDLGYYRIHVSVIADGVKASQSIWVAVCPEKAYLPPVLDQGGKVAGVLFSLYGLRSERNWGIGDFGDLKRLIDWASTQLAVALIGLNPLHATFNRYPFNTSPYSPSSKFYRNFIYLDIQSMEDYPDSKAQMMFEEAQTQRILTEARRSPKVEYELVASLKERALRAVFEQFMTNHWGKRGPKTNRGGVLAKFIEEEGDLLENFATHCALDVIIRSENPKAWTWRHWPKEYQRPDTKAVRRFRRDHWEEILYHKFIQWQLEHQLSQVQEYAIQKGVSMGLYHDLALAVDRFGADYWAYQDSFFAEASVGAPPDAFSQKGQDWGFPPPRMNVFKENGYDLFVREIRKNCIFGGALRIDHVMRFFHLYIIPEGETPDKGGYVSQPHEDLIKLVALESVRNKVVIIGEDLGTVPDSIRQRLREAGIFSYRLLYFEKDSAGQPLEPRDYPELALVTVSTHDLPTLAGFWTGRDMEIRKQTGLLSNQEHIESARRERETDRRKLFELASKLGLIAAASAMNASPPEQMTGELHSAMVGIVALTPSKLFVLNQEDLFKEVDQQNLPGTTSEYPNWSIKMKYTLEDLNSSSEAKAYAAMFRQWVQKSGRG
jgi:4-alpha-glucanotransferase